MLITFYIEIDLGNRNIKKNRKKRGVLIEKIIVYVWTKTTKEKRTLDTQFLEG